MPRFAALCFLTLLCPGSLFPQLREAGTRDYALANSSVSWLPGSASLFLNPGELARLHQNDFHITSGWFHSLESMGGDVFVPYVGTFGAGAAPAGNSTLYSGGFGRLMGNYSTIGGAVSVLSDVRAGMRYSVGGAFHLPWSVEESGLHAGASVVNLPVRGIINAGFAYWLLPSSLRLQFATQTRMARASFVGGELRVSENVTLLAGLRSSQYVSAGFSYETPYAVAELGVGSQGLSFTVNIRFGEAAAENHRRAVERANEAYADRRYSDAGQSFVEAVEYDEYDRDARWMAERSKQVMDSSIASLLSEADSAEHEDDFPTAMKAYAEIIRMNPRETEIAAQRANIGARFHSYLSQLINSGDSLLARREITRARRTYEQVLEYDPENDSASARIDQLDNLSKENVRATLERARSYVGRNRLEEAQREYEKVLSTEPNNSQAKAGLNAIRNRRVNAQLELAKTAFNDKKYFDALTTLLDILQKDPGNREARMYLDKTRDALKEELDPLFKKGLQFYIREDYKSAISEWDKVLMIQPTDSSTIEYRKRAEEKLKALEQFK